LQEVLAAKLTALYDAKVAVARESPPSGSLRGVSQLKGGEVSSIEDSSRRALAGNTICEVQQSDTIPHQSYRSPPRPPALTYTR